MTLPEAIVKAAELLGGGMNSLAAAYFAVGIARVLFGGR